MTVIGAAERFLPGEYDRVERVLERMRQVGMDSIRTTISWAEATEAENEAWFAWLLPRLTQEVEVIPCFVRDKPGPAATTAPAVDAFPTFVEGFVQTHGLPWAELQDGRLEEPPMRTEDGTGSSWAAAVAETAGRLAGHGTKVILGGLSDANLGRLPAMCGDGTLEHVHAIGLDALPAPERTVREWEETLDGVRTVLDRNGGKVQVWITSAGQSTAHHEELQQLRVFTRMQRLPVPRVYWSAMEDRAEGPVGRSLTTTGHEHGMWRSDGTAKLLAQAMVHDGGPASLEWLVQEGTAAAGPGHVTVTGGAGFVGANLTDRLLREGHTVLVYDNLSRAGSLTNLEWLRQKHGNALHVRIGDIRDRSAIREAVQGAKAVFHLAAQVAVTTSVDDPVADFEINAAGTLNVLEAVRLGAPGAFVLYASTNKVYGRMEELRLVERQTRWEPKGKRPQAGLSFATPYGCSKGAADQYVLDYAHTYGLDTTVFRMSCIYGPLQNGTVDQGWVAHFLRCARDGLPLTLYGDGKQVRDMLHVDDLVEAYLMAMQRPQAVTGRAWDIGGGPDNTSSLIELLDLMRETGCPEPPLEHDGPRPSDQAYYVADNSALEEALGWTPRIGVEEGIRRVWETMAQRPLEVPA